MSGSRDAGSFGGNPNDRVGRPPVGKGMSTTIVIVFVFGLKLDVVAISLRKGCGGTNSFGHEWNDGRACRRSIIAVGVRM